MAARVPNLLENSTPRSREPRSVLVRTFSRFSSGFEYIYRHTSNRNTSPKSLHSAEISAWPFHTPHRLPQQQQQPTQTPPRSPTKTPRKDSTQPLKESRRTLNLINEEVLLEDVARDPTNASAQIKLLAFYEPKNDGIDKIYHHIMKYHPRLQYNYKWTKWCYEWTDKIHRSFNTPETAQDENEQRLSPRGVEGPDDETEEEVVMFHDLLLLQLKLADQLVFLTLLKRSIAEARAACNNYDKLLTEVNKNPPPQSDYSEAFVAKWNFFASEFSCRQHLHWGHFFYLEAKSKAPTADISRYLSSAQRFLQATLNSMALTTSTSTNKEPLTRNNRALQLLIATLDLAVQAKAAVSDSRPAYILEQSNVELQLIQEPSVVIDLAMLVELLYWHTSRNDPRRVSTFVQTIFSELKGKSSGLFRLADAEALLYVAARTAISRYSKVSSPSALNIAGKFAPETHKALWISMLWYYQTQINGESLRKSGGLGTPNGKSANTPVKTPTKHESIYEKALAAATTPRKSLPRTPSRASIDSAATSQSGLASSVMKRIVIFDSKPALVLPVAEFTPQLAAFRASPSQDLDVAMDLLVFMTSNSTELPTLIGDYESRASRLVGAVDEAIRQIQGSELPKTVSAARKACAAFREVASTQLHSWLQDQSVLLDIFSEIVSVEKRAGSRTKVGYAPAEDLTLDAVASKLSDYIEAERRHRLTLQGTLHSACSSLKSQFQEKGKVVREAIMQARKLITSKSSSEIEKGMTQIKQELEELNKLQSVCTEEAIDIFEFSDYTYADAASEFQRLNREISLTAAAAGSGGSARTDAARLRKDATAENSEKLAYERASVQLTEHIVSTVLARYREKTMTRDMAKKAEDALGRCDNLELSVENATLVGDLRRQFTKAISGAGAAKPDDSWGPEPLVGSAADVPPTSTWRSMMLSSPSESTLEVSSNSTSSDKVDFKPSPAPATIASDALSKAFFDTKPAVSTETKPTEQPKASPVASTGLQSGFFSSAPAATSAPALTASSAPKPTTTPAEPQSKAPEKIPAFGGFGSSTLPSFGGFSQPAPPTTAAVGFGYPSPTNAFSMPAASSKPTEPAFGAGGFFAAPTTAAKAEPASLSLFAPKPSEPKKDEPAASGFSFVTKPAEPAPSGFFVASTPAEPKTAEPSKPAEPGFSFVKPAEPAFSDIAFIKLAEPKIEAPASSGFSFVKPSEPETEAPAATSSPADSNFSLVKPSVPKTEAAAAPSSSFVASKPAEVGSAPIFAAPFVKPADAAPATPTAASLSFVATKPAEAESAPAFAAPFVRPATPPAAFGNAAFEPFVKPATPPASQPPTNFGFGRAEPFVKSSTEEPFVKPATPPVEASPAPATTFGFNFSEAVTKPVTFQVGDGGDQLQVPSAFGSVNANLSQGPAAPFIGFGFGVTPAPAEPAVEAPKSVETAPTFNFGSNNAAAPTNAPLTFQVGNGGDMLEAPSAFGSVSATLSEQGPAVPFAGFGSAPTPESEPKTAEPAPASVTFGFNAAASTNAPVNFEVGNGGDKLETPSTFGSVSATLSDQGPAVPFAGFGVTTATPEPSVVEPAPTAEAPAVTFGFYAASTNAPVNFQVGDGGDQLQAPSAFGSVSAKLSDQPLDAPVSFGFGAPAISSPEPTAPVATDASSNTSSTPPLFGSAAPSAASISGGAAAPSFGFGSGSTFSFNSSETKEGAVPPKEESQPASAFSFGAATTTKPSGDLFSTGFSFGSSATTFGTAFGGSTAPAEDPPREDDSPRTYSPRAEKPATPEGGEAPTTVVSPTVESSSEPATQPAPTEAKDEKSASTAPETSDAGPIEPTLAGQPQIELKFLPQVKAATVNQPMGFSGTTVPSRLDSSSEPQPKFTDELGITPSTSQSTLPTQTSAPQPEPQAKPPLAVSFGGSFRPTLDKHDESDEDSSVESDEGSDSDEEPARGTAKSTAPAQSTFSFQQPTFGFGMSAPSQTEPTVASFAASSQAGTFNAFSAPPTAPDASNSPAPGSGIKFGESSALGGGFGASPFGSAATFGTSNFNFGGAPLFGGAKQGASASPFGGFGAAPAEPQPQQDKGSPLTGRALLRESAVHKPVDFSAASDMFVKAPTEAPVASPSPAVTEEPKTEEPLAEEPKPATADEVKPEEPKAEEPKAEEPKAEEPKAAEKAVSAPASAADATPANHEPVAEPEAPQVPTESPIDVPSQPTASTVVEEPKPEEPKSEEPKAEEPSLQPTEPARTNDSASTDSGLYSSALTEFSSTEKKDTASTEFSDANASFPSPKGPEESTMDEGLNITPVGTNSATSSPAKPFSSFNFGKSWATGGGWGSGISFNPNAPVATTAATTAPQEDLRAEEKAPSEESVAPLTLPTVDHALSGSLTFPSLSLSAPSLNDPVSAATSESLVLPSASSEKSSTEAPPSATQSSESEGSSNPDAAADSPAPGRKILKARRRRAGSTGSNGSTGSQDGAIPADAFFAANPMPEFSYKPAGLAPAVEESAPASEPVAVGFSFSGPLEAVPLAEAKRDDSPLPERPAVVAEAPSQPVEEDEAPAQPAEEKPAELSVDSSLRSEEPSASVDESNKSVESAQSSDIVVGDAQEKLRLEAEEGLSDLSQSRFGGEADDSLDNSVNKSFSQDAGDPTFDDSFEDISKDSDEDEDDADTRELLSSLHKISPKAKKYSSDPDTDDDEPAPTFRRSQPRIAPQSVAQPVQTEAQPERKVLKAKRRGSAGSTGSAGSQEGGGRVEDFLAAVLNEPDAQAPAQESTSTPSTDTTESTPSGFTFTGPAAPALETPSFAPPGGFTFSLGTAATSNAEESDAHSAVLSMGTSTASSQSFGSADWFKPPTPVENAAPAGTAFSSGFVISQPAPEEAKPSTNTSFSSGFVFGQPALVEEKRSSPPPGFFQFGSGQ